MISDPVLLIGALAGWTSNEVRAGCLIKLQIATSGHALKEGRLDEVGVVMTPNQMRVLAEYLANSADEREGKVRPFGERRWWQRKRRWI